MCKVTTRVMDECVCAWEFLPKIKTAMQAYTKQKKKHFVIVQMTVLQSKQNIIKWSKETYKAAELVDLNRQCASAVHTKQIIKCSSRTP